MREERTTTSWKKLGGSELSARARSSGVTLKAATSTHRRWRWSSCARMWKLGTMASRMMKGRHRGMRANAR